MFTIEQYVKVSSLEEAYSLNQKKTSTVLGGCGWLKMGRRPIKTAIDLSGLGLDQIEAFDSHFEIGCMATLRDFETNAALLDCFGSCISDAVRHIVGVQFRNCATIGGSIWGRFGFSDPLTLLLALEAEVRLYHAGVVPLRDFVDQPPDRDILTAVLLPKKKQTAAILSQRASATDLPILVCAAAKLPADFQDNGYRVAVGARPQRAALVCDAEGLLSDGVTQQSAQAFADYAARQLDFSSNMRGSASYRAHLTRVLVKRALLALKQEG